MPATDDLPLTLPVAETVADALSELRDLKGLTRDESYLLAKIEQQGEQARASALLRAMVDTPYDDVQLWRVTFEGGELSCDPANSAAEDAASREVGTEIR